MRHLLPISLLVLIAVAGGGCCNAVLKHGAASDPPDMGCPLWYHVDGEVRCPNRLLFEGPITLLKVITGGGGFTPSAGKKKVRVARYTGERLIVDCTSAERDPQMDVPIYPGDCIYVPRKSKWPIW